MRRLATITLGLLAALAAGCSDVKSLVGIDDDDGAATVALTPESAAVPPTGTMGVQVKVTKKDGDAVKDGTQVEVTGSLGQVEPSKFRTDGSGSASVTYRAGSATGTERLTAVSGKAKGTATFAVQAAAPTPAPAPAPSPPPSELSSVTWLDPDISRWPETSRITSASIGNPPICIEHTKAGQWPVKDGVEGNPWIFVNLDGRWYAATYEWLAPGQTCKNINADNIGSHIGRAPLSSWRPKSGELVGLMVSARARFNADTVQERSNIVLVRWP